MILNTSTLKEKIALRKSLENLVDVTFYVPCLNEELKVVTTIEKCISVANKMKMSIEVLVFNDGSTDRSQSLVEGFIRSHPESLVRLVNNKFRRGLGYNYVAGSFIGVGKYYTMICADDSETEESMISILSKMGHAEMIIPYFGNKDTRLVGRRLLSKVFVFLVGLLSGFKLHYFNGPVLHLRENVLRYRPSGTGFAFQAELLTTLLELNKSYIELQIDNNDRLEGFSRAFSSKNFLSVGHSLLQIFFRRIRRAVWPMNESFAVDEVIG